VATLFTEELSQTNTSHLPLVQCTPEHWEYWPDVKAKFDKLSMSGWMCPPIGSSY
jgi:hypothetical protein